MIVRGNPHVVLLAAGLCLAGCSENPPPGSSLAEELRSSAPTGDADLIVQLEFDVAADLGRASAGSSCVTTGVTASVDQRHSAHFNGSNSQCIFETSNGPAAQGASAVTLTTWLRADELDGIVYRQQTGSGAGYQLELKNGALVVGGRSQSSDSYQHVEVGEPFAPDSWHHVAGIIDYANQRIDVYIDGDWVGGADALSFGSSVFELAPGTVADMVGAYAPLGSARFTGALDDLRVYTRALEPGEIVELVEATLDGRPRPVVELDFESGDPLGANLGTGSDCQPTAMAVSQRRGERSARFDGKDSRCLLDAGTSARAADATGATIAAWINPASVQQGVIYRQPTNPANAGYQLDFVDGDLRMGGRSLAAEPYRSVRVPWTFPEDSGWHHVVGVIDYQGQQVRLYVDGVRVESDSVSFTEAALQLASPPPKPIVGARTSSGEAAFAGHIDQLTVFNYAVDETRVDQLFIPSVFRLDYDEANSLGQGLDGAEVCEPWGSITASVDASGWASRGNFAPAEASFARFSGSNECSLAQPYRKAAEGAAGVTMATWLRPNDLHQYQPIILQLLDSVGVGYELSLNAPGSGSGTISVRARSSETDQLQVASWPWRSHSVATWHHVVAVVDYENQRLELYIDGERRVRKAVSFGAPSLDGEALGHGSLSLSDLPLSADLDDTRLYAQPLDAEQVRLIYQSSVVETAMLMDFEAPGTPGRAKRMSRHQPNDDCAPTSVSVVGDVGDRFGLFDGANARCDFTPSGSEIPANGVLEGALGLTLSAWINPSSLTGQRLLYQLDHSGPGKRLEFGLRDGPGATTAALEIEVRDPVSGEQVIASVPWVWGTQRWHHVAGVVDLTAGELRVYVDGSLFATRKHGFDRQVVDLELGNAGPYGETIGGHRVAARGFDGGIDDVRVTRGALTSGRIQALAGQPVLRLDFDSEATLTTPTVGAGACEALGIAPTRRDTAAEAQRGAIRLDHGDRCEFTTGAHAAAVNGSRQLTVGAWLKPASLSGVQDIYTQRNADHELAYGLSLHHGNLRAVVRPTPGAALTSVSAPWPDLNRWHHVAVRVDLDHGQLLLYVDGKQVSEGSGLPAAPLDLGFDPPPDVVGGSFTGEIDDLRVYDRLWDLHADAGSLDWPQAAEAFYAPAIDSLKPHRLTQSLAAELSEVQNHCKHWFLDTKQSHFLELKDHHQGIVISQPFSSDGSAQVFVTHSEIGTNGEVMQFRAKGSDVGASGEIDNQPTLPLKTQLKLNHEDHPSQPDWIPAPSDLPGGVLVVPFENERRVVLFTVDGNSGLKYADDLAIPGDFKPTTIFVDYKDGYQLLVVGDLNTGEFIPYRARAWELFDLVGDWTRINADAFEYAGAGSLSVHEAADNKSFDQGAFTVTDSDGEWYLLRYDNDSGIGDGRNRVYAYPLSFDEDGGLVIGAEERRENLWQSSGVGHPNCTAGCSHRVGPTGKLVVAGVAHYSHLSGFEYKTRARTCHR